ncbi:endonuclease III [bacterium]|nr:endonuclease III [bacterium]
MKNFSASDIFQIINYFNTIYPSPEPELKFKTPFQLIVAAQLSAQCTDVRVNIVTDKLFKKYNTIDNFASMAETELMDYIKSCGLYKNKAKNIIACAKKLKSDFQNEIPKTRDDLQSLSGIGRKTANIILAVVHKQPAIAVDTHVFRVSRRLGFSKSSTPLGVEKDIMTLFPPETWINLHHQIIFHGRRICKARKPLCGKCGLTYYCLFFKHIMKAL